MGMGWSNGRGLGIRWRMGGMVEWEGIVNGRRGEGMWGWEGMGDGRG